MRRSEIILVAFPALFFSFGSAEQVVQSHTRPAFVMPGDTGQDAQLLADILIERQAILYVRKTWLSTSEYSKYGLVAIAGSLKQPDFLQTTYSETDLAHLQRFIDGGGALLLMGGAQSVFETAHGKRFLKKLMGSKEPPTDDTGDITTVLLPQHMWTKHLLPEEPSKKKESITDEDFDDIEEQDDGGSDTAPGLLQQTELATAPVLYKQHPWLSRSRFYWIYPERGQRIIGKRSGKTALHQVKSGRGHVIFVGWDIYRWISPDYGPTPESETQVEILRRMVSTLPVYTRSHYLSERAELVGSDPCVWFRENGLSKIQSDADGWYAARGLTPDVGPAGPHEVVHGIDLDTAGDEYESAFFHLSNFRSDRTVQLHLTALKNAQNQVLPKEQLILRVQKAFTPDTLGQGLHKSASFPGYGQIETVEEANSLAQYLLANDREGFGRPRWLFAMSEVSQFQKDRWMLPMNAGEHLSIWLTYQPYRDVKPGKYTGALRISSEGARDIELPVTVNIRRTKMGRPSLLPIAIDARRELEVNAAYHRTVTSLAVSPADHADVGTPLLKALVDEPGRFTAGELPPLRFEQLRSHLGPIRDAGVEALISRNTIVPVEALLDAINRSTGSLDTTTESNAYRRLEQWFLKSWLDFLRENGFTGHYFNLSALLYAERSRPFVQAGYKTGVSLDDKALLNQAVKQNLSTTDFWSVSPAVSESFRHATEDFKLLDPEQDEIWLTIRSGQELEPVDAYREIWSGALPLAHYKGILGIHFVEEGIPSKPLTFRWGDRQVVCAALDALRDAADSFRCYRALLRIVAENSQSSLILQQKVDSLKVGTQMSLRQFKNLHSSLLTLLESHAVDKP